MKKTSIFSLLLAILLPNGSIIAGDQTLPIDYSLSLRAGAIMPDGKVYKSAGLSKDGWVAPTLGADFSISFHPDWQALHDWNEASLGVGLTYWHLDGNRLGDAIAPYAFLDVPFVRRPHFEMGIKAGFGAAFLTRTYRNTVPDGHMFVDVTDANQSIGSVFNFYFPEQMYFRFPIRDGWSLHLAGGWYHMSNGSLRQPNSGYNLFGGELGVQYRPQHEAALAEHERGDHRPKAWEVELAMTAGGREVYYRDRQSFFCGEIQAAAYWRAHNIFRLGGGIDVFYDGAYRPRDTKFGKTNIAATRANGADCWRLGVSLQPEFVIGHFTAGFHVGVYLLDPVKELETDSKYLTDTQKAQLLSTGRVSKPIFYRYDLLNAGSAGKPDGWLYTQVVMRYRLPWHIFIQGTMKAHLTKVEFVSLGIGAWI